MKKLFFTLFVFLFATALFVSAIDQVAQKRDSEGQRTLQQAIERAVVQCYAIEGRYPSSVEYLEKNYGIQIDEEKYMVFYEGFASNIRPSITVNLL